ncbi:TolB family protein [Roseivirga sp.]|uniref:TolB family protein n=1 Tax=Roseivirga sp. TaxID=1964215 RepID=UPI003B52EE3A
MNSFENVMIRITRYFIKTYWLSGAFLYLIAGHVSGQTILFSGEKNQNWDLYALNIETGEISQLASHELKDFQSDYSPSNHEIVFDSYRDANHRNIFRLDLTTQNLFQLTSLSSRDGHPVWSPNGQKIAFQSSRTGDSEVFIMDRNGRNITQMTESAGFDGIPKWSADGLHIAFNSNRTGSPQVFVIHLADHKIDQVSNGNYPCFIQDWISKDELLVTAKVDGQSQLQIVHITNGSRITLDTPGHVTYARSNGKGKIVFTQENEEGIAEVFLMNQDGSHLTQLTTDNMNKRFPAFAAY